MSDQELMNGLIRQDAKCIKLFMNRYESRFIASFRKSKLNVNPALEAMNDFLLHLPTKKEVILTSPLDNYMTGVIFNKVRRYAIEKNTKRDLVEYVADIYAYETRVEKYEESNDLDLVNKAAKKLSKREREVFNLLMKGTTSKEMVRRGIYSNTDSVKTSKYKIIQKLKKEIGK